MNLVLPSLCDAHRKALQPLSAYPRRKTARGQAVSESTIPPRIPARSGNPAPTVRAVESSSWPGVPRAARDSMPVRAEQPVASVAQAGDDVGFRVEAIV